MSLTPVATPMPHITGQPTATPVLDVQHLTRAFGLGEQRLLAVNDVSFSILPGQVVALVGESGSGKSTLARLVLRLLEPTSGTINLDGRNVKSGGPRDYWRQVQAVFQDPNASMNQFFPIGSLMRQALGLREPRLNRAQRTAAAAKALSDVGLDPSDTLDKLPHELSGGQRQRIMIARALALEPRLLVADEPTSMLDASLRVSVLNLLKDLCARRNTAILFITHDLGQAYYLADQLLVMHHGELVESGPTESVVANPKHEYTQRLLADVPRLH